MALSKITFLSSLLSESMPSPSIEEGEWLGSLLPRSRLQRAKDTQSKLDDHNLKDER